MFVGVGRQFARERIVEIQAGQKGWFGHSLLVGGLIAGRVHSLCRATVLAVIGAGKTAGTAVLSIRTLGLSAECCQNFRELRTAIVSIAGTGGDLLSLCVTTAYLIRSVRAVSAIRLRISQNWKIQITLQNGFAGCTSPFRFVARAFDPTPMVTVHTNLLSFGARLAKSVCCH